MFLFLSLAMAGEWAEQPADPYYETDFTAFTLPPKHVRLGVTSLDVGILDNFQIGTSPLLFFFTPNVHGKVTMIEHKKFSLALQSAFLYVPNVALADGLSVGAVSYPLEFKASWVARPKWSLHLGLRVENIEATGSFGLGDLAGLLGSTLGADLTQTLQSALSDSGSLYGGAHLTLLQNKFAFDYRLNRRDSIVFQYQGYTHLNARIDAGYENTGGNLNVGASAKISQPLNDLLLGNNTLSWQFSWEHNVLRVGIPLTFQKDGSKVPIQPFFQAFEYYHLFGKTSDSSPSAQ